MTNAAAFPLVCGWSVFSSQHNLPVWLHFLESPSDIHGTVSRQLLWDLALERILHISTQKYVFLLCIIFFLLLCSTSVVFSDKSQAFFCSAYNILSFLKKKPKQPKPKKTHCPCPHTHACFSETSCDIRWGMGDINTEKPQQMPPCSPLFVKQSCSRAE